MEENTQLPKEVVEQIKTNAALRCDRDNGKDDNSFRNGYYSGYVSGATAYATKLHQVETFNGLLKTEISHLNTVIESLKAQPRPRWVKAHSGIPAGIYSMKLISRDNVEMRGTGLVNHGVIQLITFLNKSTMGIDDLPKDYEGVYYLDESPAAGNMPEPKWVKDALQWAKEAIDFTYDYVKVPDSLVETWGNMYMNTMHAIQEAQREIESPAAEREEDLTADDIVFLNECNIYIVSDGLQIITENDNGGVIQRDEVGRLVAVLNKCATKFKQQKEK